MALLTLNQSSMSKLLRDRSGLSLRTLRSPKIQLQRLQRSDPVNLHL